MTYFVLIGDAMKKEVKLSLGIG